MSTESLPALRGSPAQVKWAAKIRQSALSRPDAILPKIVDATWWIANRDAENGGVLADVYKQPEPHQLVGGPPAPPKKFRSMDAYADSVPQFDRADGVELHAPPGFDAPVDSFDAPAARDSTIDKLFEMGAERDPHEAELFAASVSRHQKLAELAILALLSRIYKGEVKALLMGRVIAELEQTRIAVVEQANKDLDGISKIIGGRRQ